MSGSAGCYLVEREREMVENRAAGSEGVVGGPTGAAAKLGIPGRHRIEDQETWNKPAPIQDL